MHVLFDEENDQYCKKDRSALRKIYAELIPVYKRIEKIADRIGCGFINISGFLSPVVFLIFEKFERITGYDFIDKKTRKLF